MFIKYMLKDSIHNIVKQPSPKSFGIVFSIVFLIVSLYPLINSEGIRAWALVVSAVFLLLVFVAPNALSLPNKLWFKFGILLGSMIAPIVMALVYFVTVLPTGLVMRLLGKDLLKQKLDKNAKSYWITLAFGSPNPLSINEWSSVHTLDLKESEITTPFKNSLKTFVSICRDWNITPVLMTQPNRLNINDVLVKSTYESGSRLKNQFSYKNYIEMYDKFNNIIREVGLSTSTLVIDLDKELSDNDKLIYDAVHLNNNGSEASAKIIAKAILDAYPNL